jgi:hypothetical protein
LFVQPPHGDKTSRNEADYADVIKPLEQRIFLLHDERIEADKTGKRLLSRDLLALQSVAVNY